MVTAGQTVFGRVSYDPARRRVTFAPDDGAVFADTQYQLQIRAALSAWDGVTLGTDIVRNFVTTDAMFVPVQVAPPTLTRDVAPILAARCALSHCHGGSEPVMGLDLSSAAAILRTAVGVASNERNQATYGPSMRTDPRWGALARIDVGATGAGSAAYSYLIYKLLGDGPIEGDRMPPPDLPALGDDEIRVVSDWIANGARGD